MHVSCTDHIVFDNSLRGLSPEKLLLPLSAIVRSPKVPMQGCDSMRFPPLEVTMSIYSDNILILLCSHSEETRFHSRLPGILDITIFPLLLWQCSLSHRFRNWNVHGPTETGISVVQVWLSVMIYQAVKRGFLDDG